MRPKRRNIRFLPPSWRLGGCIVAGLALAVISIYWLGLQPVSAAGIERRFEVSLGQSAPQIAAELKADGLIRDRNAFLTYLNFHGLRGRLKAGFYELSPAMSAAVIARKLAAGQTDANRLVVPEGSTLKTIAKRAAEHGIKPADFEAALAASHTQAFLGSKPAGVTLEGYLFPDTYDLSGGATAAQLVELMLTTFGQRVGAEYVQAFTAQGLTLHQGLTLASIVEREVNIAADRPIVAQIFLKRFREKMPLGSDVTTHYAADLAGVPFNLDINSPYNTRKFNGLPPGPICSPGLSALDAVARPAKTDYVYFLTGRDGKTYFAKTYPEHQRNITRYLN
jgi:UPF0755 protein